MADRRHGTAPPPTERDVRGEDWYGEDISGREHARTAFSGIDLTEVTDEGAVFDECTFVDCTFNVSRHTEAAFLNCSFTGCSFFDTEFDRCKLVGSMFDRCSFGLLTVTGGDWSFVGLPGAEQIAIKVITERGSGLLLGAQIVGGPGSAKRIDVLATAIWAGMTAEELAGSDLSYAPPFSPLWDPLQVAARKAVGML
jgi:uncharacterized protein YjbI with pentapeptide repeats